MLNALLTKAGIDPASVIKIGVTDLLVQNFDPMMRDEVEQLMFFLDEAADKEVVVRKLKVEPLHSALLALAWSEEELNWLDGNEAEAEIEHLALPKENGKWLLYRQGINTSR